MLVVARKRGEDIIVRMPDGLEIVIAVVQIRGDKVRIGVKAPADVDVDRREVRQSKDAARARQERLEAA